MKKWYFVIAFILLIVSIIFLLYPTVSNNIMEQTVTAKINNFDSIINNVLDDGDFESALEDGEVDKEGYPIDESGKRTSSTPVIYKRDIDRLYKDSVAYNESLKLNQYDLLVDEQAYQKPALDLYDYGIRDGIYGYVTAPSIDMKLPIYLGADESNLSCGAAHMTYTSLPIGGDDTNTVLAGHTGYTGRIFFDNICNLKVGDRVVVTNYWSSCEYKVTKTAVRKPSDSQDIFIQQDKDLLTMFTCIQTKDGVYDRYYVICEACIKKIY